MCFDTSFMHGTCCYTQFYGKCTINLCMCHMIRMIRAEAQIPQVQMDAHLSPIVFRVSVLSHWRKAIFAFSCQDVLAFAARGVVKWARGREWGAHANYELNNYCKQWSISDRSERGAVHQMDRTCSACQEKQRERVKAKRMKINKMGYAEYIEYKSG